MRDGIGISEAGAFAGQTRDDVGIVNIPSVYHPPLYSKGERRSCRTKRIALLRGDSCRDVVGLNSLNWVGRRLN
jgi:hypothetical protein